MPPTSSSDPIATPAVGSMRRRRLTFFVGLAAIVACSVWLRWPGFVSGGFANHDVGGILYNGMLLDAGLLPYVDSVEFKAPGTFYLAWWLAAGGRAIGAFQAWANAFAVASLVVVALTAYRLWGVAAGWAAALVYGAHDCVLDTMDANYVTWAQLPAVAAVCLSLLAVARNPAGRRRLYLLGAAGALGGLALILKRPAGAAGLSCVLVLVAAAWERHRTTDAQNARASLRALLPEAAALAAGASLPFAVLFGHYAAHGQAETIFRSFILNEWGWRYVAQGASLAGAAAWREGLLATTYFLALPLALCVFTLAHGAPKSERVVVRGLVVWALLSIAAAWVGYRFYKGYFLGAAAPLSMLAAAPWGLLGARSMRRWSVRVITWLPAALLLGRQGLLIEAERINRARPHDRGGRIIARRVRQLTQPGQTLWVWGWHLWDVYAFTGLRSSTRFYKTMELTTSPNDATWRKGRSPLHFRDDLAAKELLEELRATPPDCIVLGSAVPIREFAELRAFLRERYKRDRKVRLNRVQFWTLRPAFGAQPQPRPTASPSPDAP